jgi:hypothetical protein
MIHSRLLRQHVSRPGDQQRALGFLDQGGHRLEPLRRVNIATFSAMFFLARIAAKELERIVLEEI